DLRTLTFERLEPKRALTAKLVVDLNTDELGLNPAFITPFDDEVYFASNPGDVPTAELWKSDGTEEGTQYVMSLGHGEIIGLLPLGDQLIALTFEDTGGQGNSYMDVYVSDGTAEGTELIADNLFASFFQSLLEFEAIDSTTAYGRVITGIHVEPWLFVTDGTPGGTRVGPDANTCADTNCFDRVFDSVAFEGNIYFPQKSLRPDGVTNSIRVYRPEQVSSFTPQINLAGGLTRRDDQLANDFTVVGDLLYFTARTDDVGRRLWVTDGTTEGTRRVGGSAIDFDLTDSNALVAHNGSLYFAAGDESELYRVDSLDTGPQPIGISGVRELLSSASGLFVVARVPDGDELISIIDDGLTVKELTSVPVGFSSRTIFGDSLLLTAFKEFVLVSPEGEVSRVARGTTSMSYYTEVGDRLFFSARNTEGERGLWVYDGTEAREIDAPNRGASISTSTWFFSAVVEDGVYAGAVFASYYDGVVPISNEPWLQTRGVFLDAATGQMTKLRRGVIGFHSTMVEIDNVLFLADWNSLGLIQISVDE
ncbi:MAG: hypothetical protein AAF497_28420, partial [Planctomycetota bacterium]